MNRIIANPDLRRWIYGIATAGLGVLNLPGLNDGDKADEYLEKAINKLEYIEEEGMRLREEMTD